MYIFHVVFTSMLGFPILDFTFSKHFLLNSSTIKGWKILKISHHSGSICIIWSISNFNLYTDEMCTCYSKAFHDFPPNQFSDFFNSSSPTLFFVYPLQSHCFPLICTCSYSISFYLFTFVFTMLVFSLRNNLGGPREIAWI